MLEGGFAGQADDYRSAYEMRLKTVIEQLLGKIAWPRTRTRRSQRRDRFRPGHHDGRDLRPRWSGGAQYPINRGGNRTRSERNEDGAVTVGNNLPNAGVEGNGGNGSSNNENIGPHRGDSELRDLPNRAQSHPGRRPEIKRLSVAVLVGGRRAARPSKASLVSLLERLDQARA